MNGSDVSGVNHREIGVLPEGRIPFSWGQRFLCIHPDSLVDMSLPESNIRKVRVRFITTMVQRIRDIPNDRFGGIAYLDADSMTNVLEQALRIITSYSTTQALKNLIRDKGYNYGMSENFMLENGATDPVHLYPGFFNGATDDQANYSDKIAGYRMPYYYMSPVFHYSIYDNVDEDAPCYAPLGPS